MKCDYCGKMITRNQTYGVLPSGFNIHNDNPDCYRQAFITERKTIKGIMFNLKNDFLCNWDKFVFWIYYVLWAIGIIKIKEGHKK
jgi:hypothetical protein